MKSSLSWYGMAVLSNTCIAVRTGVASESFGDLPNKPIDIVLKEILEILGVFAGEFDFIDSQGSSFS